MLRRLRLTIAIGAGMLVLAWLVGRIASDRFLWSQFLFWIPTPVAAAAALIGAACTGSNRIRLLPDRRDAGRDRIVAVLLVAMGLALGAFALVREHNVWRPEQSSDGALRLLHCNIHWPNRRNAPAVMEFIATRSDDLIVLTEPGWLLLEERGARLSAAGWTVLRTGRFAVLSKLPILEARPLVRAESTDLTLLRVDGSSRGLGELAICLADLPSDPLRPRMASAQRIRSLLEGSFPNGAPKLDLVAGDLNNTRDAASLRALFPAMRDAFDDAGRGVGASWPAFLPLWQLDHVLLGPKVRAVDYTLIDTGLSAHRAQEVALAPDDGA